MWQVEILKSCSAARPKSGDIITFDEPVYGLTASGFTIQSQGANFAKLSAGNGTLKGRKYKHNT